VSVDRDGAPVGAIVAGLTANGSRALANTRDAALMASLMHETWEGRKVQLVNDGTTNEVRA
jgi:hypothetical protein